MIWIYLVVAMTCDSQCYRIPNQLIGLGYITGLMFNIQYFGLRGVVIFLINAMLPVGLLLLLYFVGGLGAGDIKLLSVMSSMVGAKSTIDIFLVSIPIAAAVVLILSLKSKQLYRKRLHYTYYISAAYVLLQFRGR